MHPGRALTRYQALSRAMNLYTTLEAPIHPLPGASGRADAPGNGYMDDSIVDLAAIFVIFGPHMHPIRVHVG